MFAVEPRDTIWVIKFWLFVPTKNLDLAISKPWALWFVLLSGKQAICGGSRLCWKSRFKRNPDGFGLLHFHYALNGTFPNCPQASSVNKYIYIYIHTYFVDFEHDFCLSEFGEARQFRLPSSKWMLFTNPPQDWPKMLEAELKFRTFDQVFRDRNKVRFRSIFDIWIGLIGWTLWKRN